MVLIEKLSRAVLALTRAAGSAVRGRHYHFIGYCLLFALAVPEGHPFCVVHQLQ